jgi:hypothetical protein
MAHQKNCPHCKKTTDNQKKGMSGGNQRYKCNECGKQWTEGVTEGVAPTKKPAAKKKAPKKAPAQKTVQTKSGKTVIKVNNNIIHPGLEGKLTKEQALEFAGEYFKELQKDKVQVSEVGDTITYSFKIETGRKG